MKQWSCEAMRQAVTEETEKVSPLPGPCCVPCAFHCAHAAGHTHLLSNTKWPNATPNATPAKLCTQLCKVLPERQALSAAGAGTTSLNTHNHVFGSAPCSQRSVEPATRHGSIKRQFFQMTLMQPVAILGVQTRAS